VDHDDNVGACLNGGSVAGFLIAAVAAIARVDEDFCVRERASDVGGGIAAGIVNDDNEIDDCWAMTSS